jgi:hypothetical protein
MSAKIIRLLPLQDRKSRLTCLPTIAFGPALLLDDLTMDHVDTAPCEYIRPEIQPGEPSDA